MRISGEPSNKTSEILWFSLGLILCLAVGFVDYLTGREISVAVFYLLPVTLVTWQVGKRTGILFAVISAIAWLLADLAEKPMYSHPAVPYWNMTVRFGFFLIVLILLSRLKEAYHREKELSNLDALTGALNARAFRERAYAEIDRSRRYRRPFTMAYIDLDNFKAVNDRFGHTTGDTLLCTVVETSRKHLRSTDLLARLGGDEFAILLPETGEEPAHSALEKISALVSDVLQNQHWPVTLSIGAITFLDPPDSVDEMIRQADELMYLAKHGGKNRIRHEVHRA